jgi:hypothetical protein
MLLLESSVRYRLSRSALARERAYRRVLRSDLNARRLFGETLQLKERRREPRHALKVPINLRPARVRGLSIFTPAEAPPFLALTRNISLGGVGFVHDEPLPPGTWLAEFDVSEPQPLVLLVEVCWTAQSSPHSYRSGVRMLGVARPA